MAFTNKNICKNKQITLSNSEYQELADQECSEIVVVGPTNGVYISDDSGVGDQDDTAFFVPANEIMTFRGITNATSLSAKSGSGTPTLYYRTQLYSSLTPAIGG